MEGLFKCLKLFCCQWSKRKENEASRHPRHPGMTERKDSAKTNVEYEN